MAAILDAQNLRKTFGAVTAADGITAAIEKDSVVGLIGTNGAGKTTFINMITGYLKPDGGAIHYEGR
ncbi:MAG: ATP-binding cassette domain-containing protein, partial [Clostridia bacterium]